jgi:hypothetical protein
MALRARILRPKYIRHGWYPKIGTKFTFCHRISVQLRIFNINIAQFKEIVNFKILLKKQLEI